MNAVCKNHLSSTSCGDETQQPNFTNRHLLQTVILPMCWQEDEIVELNNEQHKQFDPGG